MEEMARSFALTLVSRQHFYPGDFVIQNIENDHSSLPLYLEPSVAGTICARRRGLGIEGSAKIVTAAASVHYNQARHLRGKFGFVSSLQ
jgi:hypothetical protein